MTPQERWLAAAWPKVRSYLSPPPGVVVELGCGHLGGFVPRLREEGYDAVGIDPAAPEGESYQRVEFEQGALPERLDAVIACTSLHHVSAPDEVLDRIVGALGGVGVVVVVEWDWESFDEGTARWAFARLDMSGDGGWLHRHRDGWSSAGGRWEEYLRDWAHHHGLHSAERLVRGLEERFERLTYVRGPYLFPELADTSEADESAAIDDGLIQPLRLDYVGRPRAS